MSLRSSPKTLNDLNSSLTEKSESAKRTRVTSTFDRLKSIDNLIVPSHSKTNDLDLTPLITSRSFEKKQNETPLFNNRRIIGRGSFGIVTLWVNDEKEEIITKQVKIFTVKQTPSHTLINPYPGEVKQLLISNANLRDILFAGVVIRNNIIGRLCKHRNVIFRQEESDPFIKDKEHDKSPSRNAIIYSNAYINMEFCGENLHSWIKIVSLDTRNKNFIDIFYGIVCDLYVLHHNKILHNDIKPDNMLITQIEDHSGDNIYKGCLIDFGTVKFPSRNLSKELNNNTTLTFASPEVLIGGIQTKGNDIFGLGLSMLFYFTQELLSIEQIVDENKVRIILNSIKDTIPNEIYKFISEIIVYIPSHRLQIADIYNHDIFATHRSKYPFEMSVIRLDTNISDRYISRFIMNPNFKEERGRALSIIFSFCYPISIIQSKLKIEKGYNFGLDNFVYTCNLFDRYIVQTLKTHEQKIIIDNTRLKYSILEIMLGCFCIATATYNNYTSFPVSHIKHISKLVINPNNEKIYDKVTDEKINGSPSRIAIHNKIFNENASYGAAIVIDIITTLKDHLYSVPFDIILNSSHKIDIDYKIVMDILTDNFYLNNRQIIEQYLRKINSPLIALYASQINANQLHSTSNPNSND